MKPKKKSEKKKKKKNRNTSAPADISQRDYDEYELDDLEDR